MHKDPRPSATLEEMAAEATRQGREAAIMARDLRPGRDSREVDFIERCLSPLREGAVFECRHEGGFDAALQRIRVLRDREETCRHRQFVGVLDPEGDDHGIVQEVVVYSERGRALALLVERLEAFLDARQAVLDRIVAERFILTMS